MDYVYDKTMKELRDKVFELEARIRRTLDIVETNRTLRDHPILRADLLGELRGHEA